MWDWREGRRGEGSDGLRWPDIKAIPFAQSLPCSVVGLGGQSMHKQGGAENLHKHLFWFILDISYPAINCHPPIKMKACIWYSVGFHVCRMSVKEVFPLRLLLQLEMRFLGPFPCLNCI